MAFKYCVAAPNPIQALIQDPESGLDFFAKKIKNTVH